MKEENGKQHLEDFLSRDTSFDMEMFAKEVNENMALKDVLRGLDHVCDSEASKDKMALWKKLQEEMRVRCRRRMIRRWRVAAAVMMPLFCVSVLIFWKDFSEEEATVLSMEHQKSAPVQLLMADGEVLILTGLKTDTLIRKGNVYIQSEGQKGIRYESDETVKVLEYHLLQVPKGNEYHLILPDATEVWLNSDSELRFPTNFAGDERKVFLKGEGYFKVSKDASRPFRVVASELEVEVLGTCFNVNAYRDNGCLLTTLIEGSVKVTDSISGQECVLTPSQQAILGQEGMRVQTVQTDETIAWMNGCFLFSEMPLGQIVKQLERWFDVQIVFQEPSLSSHQFTGVVKRYNSLETIFSIIEETTDVEFVTGGKCIIVVHKK